MGSSGLLKVKIEKQLSALARGGEPVSAGLIARWLFDEGSGAQVADSSGRSNHALLSGGFRWVTGARGKAIALDGTGFAVCGTTGLPAPNSPLTIAWFMRLESPRDGGVVLSMDHIPTVESTSPVVREGKVGVSRWGGPWLVMTAVPPPGAWHHVAYVFDGNLHRIYVNGDLKGEASAPPHLQVPTRLELGRFGGGAGVRDVGYFTGQLDEFRIYARALTGFQIRQLSQLGR
jgi:hypothetical protein